MQKKNKYYYEVYFYYSAGGCFLKCGSFTFKNLTSAKHFIKAIKGSLDLSLNQIYKVNYKDRVKTKYYENYFSKG